MDISLTCARPVECPGSGPVPVGWPRDSKRGGVPCDPPERLKGRESGSTHAKSAARCAAVTRMESRLFVVKRPSGRHEGCMRAKEDRPQLANQRGARSPVRPAKLGELLDLVSEPEWRVPGRPTIQVKLIRLPVGRAGLPDPACPLRALPARVAAREDLRRAASDQPLAAPTFRRTGAGRRRSASARYVRAASRGVPRPRP